MSANVDAMVRAGVDAYKAGNKTEARTLLERAIELDSYNETAWLWLSAVVDTPEEQQTCLENVLVINPSNSRARQGLKSLGIDPDSVLDQSGNATPAFEEGTFDEYAVPSSSASVEYSGPQTSPDEYDNWVDGLNLGNNSGSSQDAGNQDLFGDVDFSDDGGAFDLDDNIFSEDTYGGYTEDTSEQIDYIDDDLYSDDDLFDDGDDMFADMGTLEDFTGAVSDIDDYDDSEFLGGDPFAAPASKPSVDATPEPTSQEFFRQIPKEIEATRAPGVSESAPSIHYILIAVLVLVNIGALGFLGLQLMG